MTTPQDQKGKRFGFFLASCAFSGASLIPLISIISSFQFGSILITQALGATAIIFASFSLFALLSPQRSFLYLGSVISSMSFILFWFFLTGFLFGSETSINFYLVGGLFMYCLSIIYETQLIIEVGKWRQDHLFAAFQLFTNTIRIFSRVLVILLRNSKENRSDRRRRVR